MAPFPDDADFLLADAAERLERAAQRRRLPFVDTFNGRRPVLPDDLRDDLHRRLADCDDPAALDAIVRIADAGRPARVRDTARAAEAAIARLVPRLTPDQSRALSPLVRGYLVRMVDDGIHVRTPGIDDAFDISLHRRRRVGRAFDWEFVTATLLVMGEAGEPQIGPVAEILWRRHPWERVRTAAEECLRLLARNAPVAPEPSDSVHCADR